MGTWSKSLDGSFAVKGIRFSAPLRLPVSDRALDGMLYRIGNAEHWQMLVDNLAAIVAELDRRSCETSKPPLALHPNGSRPNAESAV